MDEELIKRAIKTITWMMKDIQWRYNETKLNFEEGSQGGYSKELKEAGKVLAKLQALVA